MHQFDHRYATYTESGDTRDMTSEEKADPKHLPLPRYWVKADEIEHPRDQSYFMGYRRFGPSTNERSIISKICPFIGHGDSEFLFSSPRENNFLVSCSINSFAFDYTARQKIGGTNINFYILNQLPVLPPSAFTPPRLAFITPRVLELTYTAHDLTGFARDLGYGERPFTWNDERRFWLRAELDALYFILYGIERSDVDYIMDTFPIVKRKDIAAHGSYRTKEAILSVYDELLALGLERLGEYRSRVSGEAVAGGWEP